MHWRPIFLNVFLAAYNVINAPLSIKCKMQNAILSLSLEKYELLIISYLLILLSIQFINNQFTYILNINIFCIRQPIRLYIMLVNNYVIILYNNQKLASLKKTKNCFKFCFFFFTITGPNYYNPKCSYLQFFVDDYK